jgi:hypothetical protein
MRIPIIQGIIARRILANFRVDPDRLRPLLPNPFRPKLVNGCGMAGICLIRLRELRPRGVPGILGVSSENAAHRIAVTWEEDGVAREGVYIHRRDTNSRFNTLAGGRLFPGVHHHATFRCTENADRYEVVMDSDDGVTSLAVRGHIADQFPQSSVFGSVEQASAFFEKGSVGYSPGRRDTDALDGLELRTNDWSVRPLAVESVRSSFFDDRTRFPDGSAVFDCALLMRDIRHEWHSCEPPAGVYGGSTNESGRPGGRPLAL